MLELSADPNPRLRQLSFVGLTPQYSGGITDERIIRTLVAAVPDKATESWAYDALRECSTRLAVELLIPHLSDGDPEIRRRAVEVIWGHSDGDVIRALASLLHTDPDAQVRAQAAFGLGVTHKQEAELPLLTAIADDPDEAVREKARHALEWVRNNGPPPQY